MQTIASITPPRGTKMSINTTKEENSRRAKIEKGSEEDFEHEAVIVQAIEEFLQ